MKELICIECGKPLADLPLYNNEEDDSYPGWVLYCENPKCARNGLLTVSFTSKEIKDETDKPNKK